MKIGNGEFWLGDCLEKMKDIPDGTVDMVLCDLPYGTTYANWDKVIDPDILFEEYRRILKSKSAIVLTAINPFSSFMITRRIKEFRYTWIWNKTNASNFANAKKQPLKIHEDILVFSFESPNYYPIKIQGEKNHSQGNLSNPNKSSLRIIEGRVSDDISGLKYPKSILNFPKHSSQSKLHPTQKPVALFEYLIKTYSNEDDLILDNCAGSGTTAVAAENLNRRWICIEKEEEYYNKAVERLRLNDIQNKL